MSKLGNRLISFVVLCTILLQLFFAVVPVKASAADATSLFTYYIPTITQVTDTAGFTHPSVGLTKDLLENVRTKVRTQTEPWNTYFNAMLTSTAASATVTSSNANSTDPTKPGVVYFNSQGVEAKFIADAIKAYTQALLFYITGNEVYRANAMGIIRIWSQMDPTQYAYYTDACIHAGVPLNRIVMAAEILKYTSCQTESLAWTDKDTADFTNNLIIPVTETFLHDQNHFMNQHNYPLIGAMAGYIFTGNRDRYNESIEWFTVNATANDQGFNGSVKQLFRWVTEEQEPGIKVGEGKPVEPHVQHMEMGRDQAHGGGDLTNAAIITRMIKSQGTKVDPVAGTPSTAANAVGIMEFLNDRLLASANYFWQFMLGYDTPWTPQAYAITGGDPNNGGMGGTIRDTYNYLAGGYRGRFTTANFWDFYSYYTYIRHEDVAKLAPYYYEAFTKKLPPTGSGWYNVDAGNDFWLYLPPEAEVDAAKFIPQDKSSGNILEIEDRYSKLDNNTALIQDGTTTYIRFNATEAGSKIAILSFAGAAGSGPFGLKFRTNAIAKLDAMGQSLTLPDTKGEWKYMYVTGSIGDIAYITVKGTPGTTVDIDHINTAAATQLTPPVFKAGASDMKIYTYVGASVNMDFSATDSNSADVITYDLQNNLNGLTLDANTGAFLWKPTESGSIPLLITATDSTTIATKNVNIIVSSDRTSAVQAITASYDAINVYESATLNNYNAAYNDTISMISTASDEAFDKQLQALRSATENLRLTTPPAQDGSMRWSSVAYWSSWGTTAPNMDDCSNQTGGWYGLALGWAPDNLHHIIDFGPDYKVSATKFGFQSNIFADRLANSTVFGSNDGENWTRLTPGVTAYTQAYNTLDVDPLYQNEKYRYIKLQMIKPLPDVLYGIPNRFLELTEFRIYGTRHEIDNKIQSISMSSDKNLKGRIVLGDTVKVSITAKETIKNVKVKIQGLDAIVGTQDNINWTATAAMTEKSQVGNVKVIVDYQKTDGTNGDTLYSTTDNSKLFVADESDLINNVTNITTLIDSTSGRDAATTLKQTSYLFDNNPTTNSDYRNGASSGSGSYIIFDFKEGNQVLLSNVELLARQDLVSRAGGTVVQGSNDNAAWTTISTTAASTADWQILKINTTQPYRYIRLYNPNNWYGNLAEVKFHGVVNSLSKIASASISSPQSIKGRIVSGDTVKLAIVAKEPIKNVKVNIHGQEAVLSSSDNTNWTATAVMKLAAETGNVKFTINYDQQDGGLGFPCTTTTDNTKLFYSDESDVINNITDITNLIDSTTGRNAATTLKVTSYLFDNNSSTNSDYRNGTSSGSGSYIIFDFKEGKQVLLSNVELLARQDFVGRAGGTVVQGSNDNVAWTTISTAASSIADWQTLKINNTETYRYIRLYNPNNWFGNLAEVRFHGKVSLRNDSSLLKLLLSKATTVNTTLYTTDSYSTLQTALNAAVIVDANANATQADIDAASSALDTALKGLVYEVTASVEPAKSNGQNGWYTVPATVTIATYGEAQYRLNGESIWNSYISPIILDKDGVYTLSYKTTNMITAKTATVNIDKTAPVTLAAINPAAPNGSNGWYTSDVTVSLSAYDNLSGIARTEYQVNGGNWTPYLGSIPAFGEGIYKVNFRSTDLAGNVEEFKTVEYKIDKTAPSLTVRLDKTIIWPVNHKMVPIAATPISSDATSGIASVVLTSITCNEPLKGLSDIKANIGSTDTKFSLRAERLGKRAGRVYTITYTVTDNAGNKTAVSVTVTVPHDKSGNH